MGIKGVKKAEGNEVNSTLRYTRSIIISLLVIVLIAIFFFTVGCQSHNNNLTDGMGSAYVSSAQAMMDYTAAGQKAQEDSLPKLAVLFKAAAMMEQVHMDKLREYYKDYTGNTEELDKYDNLHNIKKFDVGTSVVYLMDSTKHALVYLMGKQSYLVNSLFESLGTQAGKEGDSKLSDLYLWFMGAESSAYRLFSDAYQNFSQSRLFTDKYNVCPRCGSIYIYGDNVQYCTVCGEKADMFMLVK